MSEGAPRQFRPGDVANGHVLTNEGQWVPLAQAPGGPGVPTPGGLGAPFAPTPAGKAKKPFWKRWWFIALAALVVIIILTNLGGNGDKEPAAQDPAPAATETAPETQAPAQEEPAAEPAEEPAANPFVEQYGTFEPVSLSGTGDMVIPVPALVGIVGATHSGSANFSISGLDANNQSTGELLVNAIGAYSGTTAFGLSAFADTVNLQLSADGAWTVTIAPIAAAPALVLPATSTGDGVFLYDGAASMWAMTHAGSSNFAVVEYGGMFPNLMVNEIGVYSGTVPAQAGPSVIEVSADGAWSITPQ